MIGYPNDGRTPKFYNTTVGQKNAISRRVGIPHLLEDGNCRKSTSAASHTDGS
jgi:hypothetical protein